MFQLPGRPASRGSVTSVRLLHGRLADFRPDDLFRNPGLVGDPVRELVAGRRIRNPGRHRQHPAQELPPAVVVPEIEPRGRLIEQVLQIRPRRAQSVHGTASAAVPPDERIGIFALVQHHDVDVEPFGDQQLARPRRRALPGRVRIEAEDDLRREPPEQLRLLRRQRRAARGDRPAPPAPETPARSRSSPRPAPRSPAFRICGLRQVQPVQRPALRVDRRLGRVQVLRPP